MSPSVAAPIQIQETWFLATNDDALHKYEHEKPVFVSVFRLLKGIGKAKRGDFIIMDGPTLIQRSFYTVRQWRNPQEREELNIDYNSKLLEFAGYFQKSGVKMFGMNHVDDLPSRRDRDENP